MLRDANPQLFKTAGYSLARQFLEGVQFLHHNLVAHLDLKPNNIVVGAHTQLHIIDFGVAVRVSELDSQITGYQGTKGYVAPEVEQNPDAPYQPIRADLWSTGEVLRFLARRLTTHCYEIDNLAGRLQDPNPQQRPLLSMIRLDTLFKVPSQDQANRPFKLKRKLGGDAHGREEIKRICVPTCPSMDYLPLAF